jgi:hypothetical protein
LASSQLSAYKAIDYKPENAHDLSFKSAWVEGVEGYGIGEYIEYYFENQSARITNIIIYNGYVKSERLWKTNSRVKKLKLYINDIPYAILNLEDSRSAQKFDIDTLGQRDDGKDLVLRFEIIEAYPGTKYEDVAITEIYFDGIDVHCLIAGTLIKMSNGSDKLIEKLEIGDDILTYDLEHNKLLSTKITRLDSIIHCNLIEYNFADKSKIVATDEHPFLLKDKGWSSYNPDQSKKYQYCSAIQKIEIGDTFKKLDLNANLKDIKLLKIQVIHESQMTYTISGLENNLIFIANGFLVGIEELRDTNLSIR